MVYRAIGLMSGSSLDGLDITFVEFQEQGGKWSYEIQEATCYPYPEEWIEKLQGAINLSARDYQLLHAEYGQYTGRQLNKFIKKHQLDFKVAVIGSHGHTTFHMPDKKMTAQLGDGAAIAAATQLPVVSDLRALDVAFGGQGAPIVPIGEKLLMSEYEYFLNIGGIANLSLNAENYIAFDVCPANRVLNMLVNETGIAYDDGGQIAAGGTFNDELLQKLNQLSYYKQTPPKSLANDLGTDVIFPLIKEYGLELKDALRTYTEHIAMQIKMAVFQFLLPASASRLLATGGGAFNKFLIQRIAEQLQELKIEVVVPDAKLVNYKEAMIMAFIGVLRWRQENNVLSSVTGAVRDSIGGALWIGQEA